MINEQKHEICMSCENKKLWKFPIDRYQEVPCYSCVLVGQSYDFPDKCPIGKFGGEYNEGLEEK